VQHTEADIDKHLAVFDEIAPGLAKAQTERGQVTAAAGHNKSRCSVELTPHIAIKKPDGGIKPPLHKPAQGLRAR